ncbi:MAG TPA: hypothetical protein VKD25_06830 [Burkholderiales bacterium]|nr:hypothetical protein [Burkholderiales bacterium]
MNPLTAYPTLLTLLTLGLLAGCASIEKTKDSWQGAHYDEVIARWGAPYRSAKLADGSPVHTWVAEGGYGGGPATSVGIFGGSGGGGVGVGTSFIFGGGGAVEPTRCERTLTFRNDRVVEQSWIGDPSFCSQFRKE